MNNLCDFSEDRAYRYRLLHEWNPLFSHSVLCVIGLNPSTADEQKLDATLRKVRGFGSLLGCGALLMLNLGAYRATDPKEWKKAADPFGPRNTPQHLAMLIRVFKPKYTFAAWGSHASWKPAGDRAAEIKELIPNLYCWGFTNEGHPKHPLMIPYSSGMERFNKLTMY